MVHSLPLVRKVKLYSRVIEALTSVDITRSGNHDKFQWNVTHL